MVDRRALLIGTSEYVSLPSFRSSRADVVDFATVLDDPEIGDYEVTALHDPPIAMASSVILDHFRMADQESELLLYLSGHALTDGTRDRLYLALADTLPERVAETGYPIQRLQPVLSETRARDVIIILDWCFSVPAAEVSIESAIPSILGQRRETSDPNLAVLAFSLHKRPADWEAAAGKSRRAIVRLRRRARRHDSWLPLFTDLIIRGMRFGEADLNSDGMVTVAELHDYLTQHLQLIAPGWAPSLFGNGDARQIKISMVPELLRSAEYVTVNPCPNCSTDGGHRYKVPIDRTGIAYLGGGPKREIRIREFRVVFRCPVSSRRFAVTLRLWDIPAHNVIMGVGEPVLRSPRTQIK